MKLWLSCLASQYKKQRTLLVAKIMYKNKIADDKTIQQHDNEKQLRYNQINTKEKKYKDMGTS